MKYSPCTLCKCSKELEIVGDPFEQIPGRVWDGLRDASLIDRGVDVKPEAGSWYDQPASWCALIEYALSERARMRQDAQDRELERLIGG